MSLDKQYLVCALVYAAVGMGLGVVMAASHDHAQFITHTHVLLVGFVTSLLYAVVHRLWLPTAARTLSKLQFFTHQAGALIMMLGLGIMFGSPVHVHEVEPILAAGSIAVLVGALLMLLLVARQGRAPSLTSDDAIEGLK